MSSLVLSPQEGTSVMRSCIAEERGIKRSTAYQYGCRCILCRRAKSRDSKARNFRKTRGVDYMVDPAPSRRKIGALGVLGWSAAEISRRAGYSRDNLARALRNEQIYASTAEAINEAFEALSMKRPLDNKHTRRIATIARRAGNHPPLAWDDIEAGVLADDRPRRASVARDRYDEEVLDFVWSEGPPYDIEPLSRIEKIEIVRRWLANGRSQNELETLTGWNVNRYARELRTPTQEEP